MSSVDTNVQSTDRLVDSLLAVNQLQFTLPPQLGITTSRKHVTMFPQQASYTGGTVIFDSQTGSSFIDPSNSYFVFKITTTSTAASSFGSGSVANLIDRIVVRSRSGKELSRVDSFGLWAKYSQLYDKTRDWTQTIGSSQGYPDYTINAVNSGLYGVQISTGVQYTFIMPLSIIPCFKPLNGKLLPPQLMEGLRIEINLNSAAQTFTKYTATATAITGYTLTPEIHFDTFVIADQFQRKINEMAQRSGLKLLYEEAFHTIVVNTVNTINFDIKKSASKALRLMIIPRDNTYITSTDADSFASSVYPFTSQQINIGSEYMPNQKLDTPVIGITGNAESYYQTQFAMSKLEYGNAVSPTQYTGVAGAARTAYSSAMIAYMLDKSNVNGLNGFVINNSRSLVANFTVDLATAGFTTIRLDCYLVHLRSLDVMTSNVAIAD